VNREINIGLFGAGNLGSRHLQALAQIQLPSIIWVVDPNDESLAIAEERFHQVSSKQQVKKIEFSTSIDRIPSELDLCVISTNADIRLNVLDTLLKAINIKYLLLEKVLFQSESEIEIAAEILNKQKVKTWINCPRRMYPFYQKLKTTFPIGEKIHYELQGGNWGIGCNSIHHFDLLAWLTEDNLVEVDTSGLELEILKSKRSGFHEFTGTLYGRYANGSECLLTANQTVDCSSVINIKSDSIKIEIRESKGEAIIARKETNWKRESHDFRIPFQSELTHQFAYQVLKTGQSVLADFNDSADLHRPFLNSLIQHLNKVTGKVYSRCPIT